MELQPVHMLSMRFVLALLVISIAGCGNQTIRDYAKLTSQTTADLDSKIRLYASSSADFDASRQELQRNIETQNNIASDGNSRDESDWVLIGDKDRPVLLKQIQIDSESSLAIQMRPVPSSAALTPIASPPELIDVAKATDQLSRKASAAEQVKEAVAYGKEVYGDLNKDKASKTAEASLTEGVKKTPPIKKTPSVK